MLALIRSEVVMQKLTNRESEILRLAGEGMSAQEIADLLYCSRRTVEFHLANLYTKLEVSNRVQALRRATSLGLLSAMDQREMAIR
ncbi:MAG: response regulator transcription factor [Armatimonadota bacterium]